MAYTGEAGIADAIFTAVDAAAATTNPPVTVAYPDVPFTPETELAGDGTTRVKPYLVADVLFNEGRASGIAFDSDTEHTGLLSLNLVWPAGQGVLKPLQFAGQIVAAFKAGTVMAKNTVAVRVYERPRIAPYMEDNDRVTVPITVSWRGCTPVQG